MLLSGPPVGRACARCHRDLVGIYAIDAGVTLTGGDVCSDHATVKEQRRALRVATKRNRS